MSAQRQKRGQAWGVVLTSVVALTTSTGGAVVGTVWAPSASCQAEADAFCLADCAPKVCQTSHLRKWQEPLNTVFDVIFTCLRDNMYYESENLNTLFSNGASWID